MQYIWNLDEKVKILTARYEQAESMAAAAQAKSLLARVKTLVQKAFMGSMDSKTIRNLTH